MEPNLPPEPTPLPQGCLPAEFWRTMYNLSDAELHGSFISKLGLPVFQLQRCGCSREA